MSLGLFYLQVFRGRSYHRLSLKNSIRLITYDSYRGRIYDRNGLLLADNVLSFDVALIPQEVTDKGIIFRELGRALGMEPSLVQKKYEKGYLNPFTPVVIVSNVAKTTAISIAEKGLDLRGVEIELNSKRFYPHHAVGSHVLGYLGEIDRSRVTKLKEYGYDLKDKVGYGGLEEKLDIFMRGRKGGQQIEVDSLGRQVRLLGYKPPQIGQDVRTTIDLEMQEFSDEILKGAKGAVVLMDVDTGEILIMSSAPSFDPNVFINRGDTKVLNYYLTSPEAVLFNRATRGQFPPGSVFKIVTAVAAMEAKKFPPSKVYECSGKLKVGDRYFKCWTVHGAQNFYQAMGHSCDIYFYRLGLSAGPDLLSNVARDFGLASQTGVDLPRESAGFIPNRLWKRLSRLEGWYDGDTANFSIGQGYVLTTPLQLTRMMAILGNGGFLVEPRLTKAINGSEVEPPTPRRISVESELLEMVKESLRYPVSLESGTAHILDIPGLDICAKTGTAQVTGAESHGWVAGFFPKKKPRFAFCILLENVGTSHYACVLGRRLFEEAHRRGKI